MLEIGFMKEMRTTWGTKEVPQTMFYYFSIPRKWILSIWLCTIGNLAFRTFVTLEKDDFKKFLADYYQISRSLFRKKFCKLAITCKMNNPMLIIEHYYFARNFAKSSFYEVTKFRNAGLLMLRSQTD